jgi:hypothetical protein
MKEKEIKFDIRYVGGDANENRLNLYDASTSILGFSRAIAIISNTLATKGEVRFKGSTIPNVEMYLHPSKKGSLIETVSVVFKEPAIQAIGIGGLVSAFWAMLEYSWKIATDQEVTTDNRIVKKIIADNETIDLQLIDALESPFQQVHRPIAKGSDMKIQINRPRVGKVIELNYDTKEYVSSIIEKGITNDIQVNVTKYNINTGYGRLYADDLKMTIPFNIDKSILSILEEETLKWSLFKSSKINYSAGKILISASIINTKQNKTKRYIIVGAKKIETDGDFKRLIK